MAEARMISAVVQEEQGQRLDVFVSAAAEITRSRAGSLIDEGCILVNGKKAVKSGYKLRPGDEIAIEIPEI